MGKHRLLRNVVYLLVHFVRGLDYFGIGLIRALTGDHIDELLDHADIRGLDVTLLQCPHSLLSPGVANRRIAAGIRRQEKAVPGAVQASWISEVGELDLARHLGSALSRKRIADGAVLRDGNGLRLRTE